LQAVERGVGIIGGQRLTMKVEVLLATINQTDDSVLDAMGVHSDVIVCNQNSTKSGFAEYIKADSRVRWYDFQEKGVGLNRNNALIRAEGDICLLADDDVQYFENYESTVLRAFEMNPEADVILFNIESPDGKKRSEDGKTRRINLHNCGKYGAVRIAFRRMSVIKNAIFFNQLFGGGCMFTAGEDTMFLRDCLRKKLRMIAVPDCILRLTDNRPSTWFEGYNQKFFEDFGSSYYCHYGSLAWAVTLLQLFRQRKKWLCDYPLWRAWSDARRGIVRYKRLR